MKRFFAKILLFICISIVFTGLLFIFRVSYTNSISWKIPSNKHIVFMGASHIVHGIDPVEYPNSINIASISERYMFTYIKLKKLLEANPQIDTIFLEFAPTDTWENTDTKYFTANEMSYFLPMYFPFFTKNEWKVYSRAKLNTTTILFQKLLWNLPDSPIDFGGFEATNGVFERNNEPYPIFEWLREGHSINYHYLNEIINTCKNNDIKLFFLYMPMYRKDYFYDCNHFYDTYKKSFSEIPLFDFSDWDCPDEYRQDEHHLNITGAKVFTCQLKKHLSENFQNFIQSKSNNITK